MQSKYATLALGLWLGFAIALTSFAANPLASWNDTTPKRDIVTFVEKVAMEGSPDFVPVPARIAVFDNDGTLWAEDDWSRIFP